MNNGNSSVLSTPDMTLEGRVAVVTGAGRGLGLGSAMALAAAGAETILISRTEADIRDAAAEIVKAGGKASHRVCDVTDPEQVADTLGALDRIDILVNNAGTNIPEPFLQVSQENLDHVLNLNVRALFLTSQTAAAKMVEQKSGSIINMSSQMGHVGAANRTAYCMTKHAVEGLTKAMAVELAPNGIRVNSIAPTFIETPLAKKFFENKEFLEQTLAQIPLGHIGKIEDIMGAVLFLASDASALMTGTSMVLDGGWTAK